MIQKNLCRKLYREGENSIKPLKSDTYKEGKRLSSEYKAKQQEDTDLVSSVKMSSLKEDD